MYICEKCNQVFSEPRDFQEKRGEFWGEPAYELVGVSPCCGDDYVKATRCPICEEYKHPEHMCGDVCAKCVDKCKNDVETCFEVARQGRNYNNIKINGLVTALLSEDDINLILLEYLMQHTVDCTPYIDEDASWFSEQYLKLKEVSE